MRGGSGGGGRVCLEQIGNVYAHRPPPFLLLLQPKNSNPEARARSGTGRPSVAKPIGCRAVPTAHVTLLCL